MWRQHTKCAPRQSLKAPRAELSCQVKLAQDLAIDITLAKTEKLVFKDLQSKLTCFKCTKISNCLNNLYAWSYLTLKTTLLGAPLQSPLYRHHERIQKFASSNRETKWNCLSLNLVPIQLNSWYSCNKDRFFSSTYLLSVLPEHYFLHFEHTERLSNKV